MRKPLQLSRRRRKLAVRQNSCFAIAQPLDGAGDVELTLFAGRRALTRVLTPVIAAALAHALSRGGQSE